MPSLPDNRIRYAHELRELAGREVHFVTNVVDPFNRWQPYMDTDMFTWLVGPLVCAAQLESRDDTSPHYTDKLGLGSTAIWCLHAEDVIADAEMVRMIRLSDFNCIRSGGKRYSHQAVFRTAKDAELWRIMIKLSFDEPCPTELGNIARSVFEVERYHVLQAMRNWMGLKST